MKRNIFGCVPCPACGGRYRYPFIPKGGRAVIACDDCGRCGPWDGMFGDDGYSVDETPAPAATDKETP